MASVRPMRLPDFLRPEPRSSGQACRGRSPTNAALVAITALFASCTTTHTLGRIDDPGTRAQLDALSAEGGEHVQLLDDRIAGRPPVSYRVAGVSASGLLVEPARGQSLVVPLSQVVSVSRTDRGRGALEGAFWGGILGFAAPLVLRTFLPSAFQSGCADDCSGEPGPTSTALHLGVVVGLLGAVIGGGLGAAFGHEDRIVVAPPK